jgi:hypothetical protein
MRIFLFIASLALPQVASADTEAAVRTVELYDGLASIEIPIHWNEIPPDVLEFFTLQSAERSGGLVTEFYQHGFRPGNPEADFMPPQILIQIKENGRLSYGQFLHLPPVDELRERSDDRMEEHMGPFMEDLRLNDVFFDRESYSIMVANTLDLSYEGKVVVQSVSYLTERGLFTVHCYALLSQNLRMKSVFADILESVRFDDSLRYHPRLGDRLPPRPALVSYAIAVVLAVIIVVVHLVQRRRRRS